MNKVYVYEIYLDELLIGNSGDEYFETEEKAFEDANTFLEQVIINDDLFKDDDLDDFDITVMEIDKDKFGYGW